MSAAFQDAVNVTPNPSSFASSMYNVFRNWVYGFFVQHFETKMERGLACLTCDAFGNWAESFIQRLEARLVQNSTELQDECNED